MFLRAFTYEPGLPGLNSSTFLPIQELARNDADTWLFFLTTSNVGFIQPVNDEFFAAHRPNNGTALSEAPQTNLYYFDDAVHALGCTAQKQWCFGENHCTPLLGWYSALDSALAMNDSAVTAMRRKSLEIWAAGHATLAVTASQVITSLGVNALLARDGFSQGVQGPILPDQWQREVEYWQATTMAKTQRIGIEYAAGPSYGPIEKYIQKPYDGKLSKNGFPDKITEKLCKSQVR